MRRTDKWILNGRVPEACSSLLRWAKWIETADRHVAVTYLADNAIRISTVFLGLDHNFDDSGPPILFETMIFGGSQNESMDRYSTWEQAERGHARMVGVATEALACSNVVAGLLADVVINAIRSKIKQ